MEGTIFQRDEARAASHPTCACDHTARPSVTPARDNTAPVKKGNEKGLQAQQRQVRERSVAPAASNVELDDEGFGVKQVKEVMFLSKEGLKPEEERCLQRGRASSAARGKKKEAAPGKHMHGSLKYEYRKPTVEGLSYTWPPMGPEHAP